MSKKVVFLAYAHSSSNPLPGLKDEYEGVYATLVNDVMKGSFIVHPEFFATRDSINKYLQDFSRDLLLFLYSGHAGSSSFLLEEEAVHAGGIAYQLKESARSGSLKLVILNGCSTAGQVKRLLQLGVPAVIATSAPVNDSSASAFAIRFFENITERGMTIRQAFENALGPAQNATSIDLHIDSKTVRGLDFLEKLDEAAPTWELFTTDEQAVDINPLPSATFAASPDFRVNKYLRKSLFDALVKEGNEELMEIKRKEDGGRYVEIGDKDTEIVNVLPFPIGIHLQKLLCPVDIDEEGYDKLTLRRIRQICEVYHVTIEFMGYVMLAQLWEERLRGRINELPPALLEMMRRHFFLGPEERKTYNYLPFIRGIREYFDTLNGGAGIGYFIEELNQLRVLTQYDSPFAEACDYLTRLRDKVEKEAVREDDVSAICEQAELKLGDFFSQLGFMHRYHLTSIQSISILKLRHQKKGKFNHSVIKLMRAIGGSEKFLYYWDNYLDCQGVVLLKGSLRLVDEELRQFEADGDLAFLNLSPFLIDINAFEKEADQPNLMMYIQFNPATKRYSFRKVRKPGDNRGWAEIGNEQKYKVVKEEMDEYRFNILNLPQ